MKILSKSETIGNILKQKIMSRKYNPGDSFPTEFELCREYGVSRTVIREAMSGLVREGLLQRTPRIGTVVLKQAEERTVIGFMSSLLYQEPVAGKNFFDTTHYVHFCEWTQILSLEASKYNATIVHVPRFGSSKELLSMLKMNNISKMILFGSDWLLDQKAFFKKQKIQFCSIFETEDKSDNYIVFDNYDGARQAASHVLSKGYRDIVVLTGNPEYKGYQERIAGFKSVFADKGLDPGLVKIIRCEDEGANTAYNTVKNYLKNDKPEAFLCCSDFMAYGAHNAVVEYGLSVPGDIGIMGYDGLLSFENIHPKLSTIRTPRKEIAKESVKFLTDPEDGNIQMTINSELIKGETL